MKFVNLKNLLLKNAGLKLIALVFSAALWFFVVGEKTYEVGMLVTPSLKKMPEGIMAAGALPNDVEVMLKGATSAINNLSPTDIIIELDLSKATLGVNTYTILPKDVKTPKGIEVVRIRPSSIEIRLEETSDK